MTGSSRISRARIIEQLRAAGRRGDRAALQIALGEMRTLALSPRYWERYLELLDQPLARLVDLLVIKQGERIAAQKGWTRRRRRGTGRSRARGGKKERGQKDGGTKEGSQKDGGTRGGGKRGGPNQKGRIDAPGSRSSAKQSRSGLGVGPIQPSLFPDLA